MTFAISASSRSQSLCNAEISNPTILSAVDTIIKQMAPIYLMLMQEAKARPEIISDYKTCLADLYNNLVSLTPKQQKNMQMAQMMAPDCQVISNESTKMLSLSSQNRISVFSEYNKEFDANQPLDKARLYIRLRVNAKDLTEVDPLDHLLSQLSKKILSLGYGKEGTFDIRLEKGCMSLEGESWNWHYDGEAFKTSISVCYSNKPNWSTRISAGPATHGCLYDALHVWHRAPIPSDLEGEKLNADDYRLFIRYNESNTHSETKIPEAPKEEKEDGIRQIKEWVDNFKPMRKNNNEWENLINIQDKISTIPIPYPLLMQTQVESFKINENLRTSLTLKDNYSALIAKFKSDLDSSSFSSPSPQVIPIPQLQQSEQPSCTLL